MKANALACFSFVLLAACAAPSPDRRAEIGQVWEFRPGTGIVVSMTRAPAPLSAQSADVRARSGAGATTGGSPEGMFRLGVRMDNGVVQYIDTDSEQYVVGSRVELTPERHIRRL